MKDKNILLEFSWLANNLLESNFSKLIETEAWWQKGKKWMESEVPHFVIKAANMLLATSLQWNDGKDVAKTKEFYF